MNAATFTMDGLTSSENTVRFARPKRMSWWLLAVLTALLGWVLSNLIVHFYYAHLADLLAAAGGINSAPQDLIDRWQSDGAKRAFAYMVGWLYGPIYSMPWLVIYLLGAAVRKRVSSRSPS